MQKTLATLRQNALSHISKKHHIPMAQLRRRIKTRRRGLQGRLWIGLNAMELFKCGVYQDIHGVGNADYFVPSGFIGQMPRAGHKVSAFVREHRSLPLPIHKITLSLEEEQVTLQKRLSKEATQLFKKAWQGKLFEHLGDS